ncbi:MAG: class I SAM-dependent methyltransferase [Pseudomonadota bacterium]
MVSKFMASQYALPRGLFGRLVTSFVLNRSNRLSNRSVLDAMNINAEDSVLEVGFGGADLLVRIAQEKAPARLVGVEKSADMINRGRSLLEKNAPDQDAELLLGEIESLPLTDGEFDVICSVNTIYFWSDLGVCAKELRRVARPGGQLVIGYSTGIKLVESGYTEYGFRFYRRNEVDTALWDAGWQLKSSIQIARRNKDLFIVSTYDRT